MEVRVRGLGHVVVENDIDTLNVHSSSEEIGGHKDSLLEVLECLISREALLLGHLPVDGNGGEILLREKGVKSNASLH